MNLSVLFFNLPSRDVVVNYDFIINDLLQNFNAEVQFLFSDQIENQKFDVFVFSCFSTTREAHFGNSPDYATVLNAVNKVNPKIIIQLSDEFWQENNNIYNELGNYCELFIRQHSHWNQTYTNNTIQMPLGYLNNYPVDLKNIKSIEERNYSWSWVGYLKSDRQEMLYNFSLLEKNYCKLNGGFSEKEIFNLYSDSKFVPIGRGNSSIDCWRIYEAIVCGAIPVIVSNEDEINCVFRYKYKLPAVFASTWGEAKDKCAELLENNDKLYQKQKDLLEWWDNTVHHIQNEIEKIFFQKAKKSISLICACKNRNAPLQISLASWLLFEEIKEIIIVDWSSDQSINYLTQIDPRIKVITVQGQQYFNQPQPLNLAASIATGDYILKVDVDYILNPYFNFFDFYHVDENSFLCGQNDHGELEINSSPYFKHLRGLLFISRENYLKVGGYNEEHTKYYAYEDDEIVHRLELLGLEKKKVCYNHNIIHIPHSDKKRIENFEAYHTDKQLEENIRQMLSTHYTGEELEWQVEYVLAQQHIEINRQKSLSETKDYYFQSKIKWNLEQIDKGIYTAHKIFEESDENFKF